MLNQSWLLERSIAICVNTMITCGCFRRLLFPHQPFIYPNVLICEYLMEELGKLTVAL